MQQLQLQLQAPLCKPPFFLPPAHSSPQATDPSYLLRSTHFLAGFAFLPLFWAVNVWLYWPTFKSTPPVDPVVKKCALLGHSWLLGELV